MSETIKQEIDKYIALITTLSGVLQIYLFGSYAYGEPEEYSDIDLFIIVEDSLDPINTTVKINHKLVGKRTTPLDIVVNRKKDFSKAVSENTIQKHIADNGVLLYEAS
ncbi:MAG: nucleotidyltransferase domain-containing protein [Oscillospiraceae bacterium]|nr:nucleotidyltransferase domain-containing protein [Oscillospiraceae bacterium]